MYPDFRNLTIDGPEPFPLLGGYLPIPFTPPSGVEYSLGEGNHGMYYTIAWDWDLDTVTIRYRNQTIAIEEPLPSRMLIAGLTNTPYGALELKLSNDPRLEGYDVYVTLGGYQIHSGYIEMSSEIGVVQYVAVYTTPSPSPAPLQIENLVGNPVIPSLNYDDVITLSTVSSTYAAEGVVHELGLDSVDDIPTVPRISSLSPQLFVSPWNQLFHFYLTNNPEYPLQNQILDLEWELTIPLNPIEPEPEPEPTSTSILQDVKKLLSVPDNYDVFDLDISIWINSAFSTLHELGVGGQSAPFQITGPTETWLDFTPDETMWNNVKTYVYLRARLGFDPPQSAHANAAMQKMVEEHEWRLNVKKEGDIL